MASIERARVKALAHLEMSRPYTVFHAGLVALGGAVLASTGHVAWWRAALAALVTMCGWIAGLYAGDYYDRGLDVLSKPDRPVPSGRVAPREAFMTMLGLIAIGYVGALALGVANLALAVVTTALGIAYSKVFKSHALMGNFDRGVLGVCAVLFGALAGGNVVAPAVWGLAGMVFFHDSATNLVGAMRDVDGDRAARCATVPVRLGQAAAAWIAGLLAAAWMACGIALLLSLRPNALAAGLFAGGAALALAVYVPLWLGRRHITRAQALRGHKLLVVERLLLLSGIIAVYTPAPVAVGILLVTAAATVVSQALLRDRSERQSVASSRAGRPVLTP